MAEAIVALCMVPVACGFCAGSIVSFAFTITFLVWDAGKGGVCANTTGHAIWVYVIVKLVVDSCTGSCTQFTGQESSVEQQHAKACCALIVSLAMAIYGGVVIFDPNVCDQYKQTGQYQMVYILYIMEIVAKGLVYCCCIPLALYFSREDRGVQGGVVNLQDLEAQQEHPIVAVARRTSGFPITASAKLASSNETPLNGELAVATPANEKEASNVETGELIASPVPAGPPAIASELVLEEAVAVAPEAPVSLPPPPAPASE